jgi:hypothetical protein
VATAAPPRLGSRDPFERWRNLPAIDPDRLRRDIDAVIDPSRDHAGILVTRTVILLPRGRRRQSP